ncbi:MAG TPA: hypothetical protein VFW13_06010, partial [Phenylobacterium sp.]|nr:hypothetical protein [Phenylobacterium sp.]
MRTLAALAALALLGLTAGGAQSAPPRSAGIKDPDTKAWWQIAEALSSDAMEGRDIGSPGHHRAALVVAARFKSAGLTPAGDNGSYFQTFPVHESRVEKDGTSFAIWRGDRSATPLEFLHAITVRPTDSLPASLDAAMTFRGYCAPGDLANTKGMVVICFNSKRSGLPTAGQRVQAARNAGAAGIIQVDDPYFTIEPPRWPAAYARSVSIAGATEPVAADMPVMTLSAEAFK